MTVNYFIYIIIISVIIFAAHSRELFGALPLGAKKHLVPIPAKINLKCSIKQIRCNKIKLLFTECKRSLDAVPCPLALFQNYILDLTSMAF